MKVCCLITFAAIASANSAVTNDSAIKTHEAEFAPTTGNFADIFTAELASIKNELAIMNADNAAMNFELDAVNAKMAKQDIELAAMKADKEEQDSKLAAVEAELAAVKSNLSAELAAAFKSKYQLKKSAEDEPFSDLKKNRVRQLRESSKEDERDNDIVDFVSAGKAHESERALPGFPVNPLKKLSSDWKLDSYYVFEKLDAGETRRVFESGPIRIDAGCGAPNCVRDGDGPGVCLNLSLQPDKDLYVIGTFLRGSLELKAGDVYTDEEIWGVYQPPLVSSVDGGAFWTSGGHYFGWDGDSLIGVEEATALPIAGGNCIIAGVVNYHIPAFGESV